MACRPRPTLKMNMSGQVSHWIGHGAAREDGANGAGLSMSSMLGTLTNPLESNTTKRADKFANEQTARICPEKDATDGSPRSTHPGHAASRPDLAHDREGLRCHHDPGPPRSRQRRAFDLLRSEEHTSELQ